MDMARHAQGSAWWQRRRKVVLLAGALAVMVGIGVWETVGSTAAVRRDLRPLLSSASSAVTAAPASSVSAISATSQAAVAAQASPQPVLTAPASTVAASGTTGTPVPSWLPPVTGQVLQGYGWAYSPILGDWQLHTGVDLATVAGETVVAPAAGTVAAVRDDPLWGWVVSIALPNGYATNVSGLEKVTVTPGQQVTRGQSIGLASGSSPPAEANLAPHVFWQTFSTQGAVLPPS